MEKNRNSRATCLHTCILYILKFYPSLGIQVVSVYLLDSMDIDINFRFLGQVKT